MMKMKCNCGNLIEEGRLAIGMTTCKACAFRKDVPKYKGNMVYSHKTAPVIQIMSSDCFEEQKKYYNPHGARSAVKNFSKNVCA